MTKETFKWTKEETPSRLGARIPSIAFGSRHRGCVTNRKQHYNHYNSVP